MPEVMERVEVMEMVEVMEWFAVVQWLTSRLTKPATVSEKENLELMLYPNFSTGQLPFSQTMHPDWFKLVT